MASPIGLDAMAYVKYYYPEWTFSCCYPSEMVWDPIDSDFDMEYYQSTAQINYVNHSEKYTRVVEHKYLSGQKTKDTTVSFEYPQSDGEPFYPIPTDENRQTYLKYSNEIKKLKNVQFIGRLAEYQYYNMDQVVAHTLNIFGNM